MKIISDNMHTRDDPPMRNNTGRYNGKVTDFILSNRTFILASAVFICISLLLAARGLYTAPDDDSYVSVFDGGYTLNTTDWWGYFLNEPLWVTYTMFMASIFDAETSLRITIFISSLMFLFASTKLARGAWLFVSLAFIFDATLANQIYYNQIRQGFGLSIFLMIAAMGFSPLLGALVAAAMHSSFIFVIPCIALTIISKHSRSRLTIGFIMLAAVIFLLRPIFENLDLGRRADTYELKNILSIFFYIVAILQYGAIFFILKDCRRTEGEEFWFRFTFIFLSATLFLTFFHEAAARYICVVNICVMILIGRSLHKQRENFNNHQVTLRRSFLSVLKSEAAMISAVVWLLFLWAVQFNESAKADFGQESWVGRWAVILGA